MNPKSLTVDFERRHTLLWVCDIQGSSSALNDPRRVESTEEFLKRFFCLSALLVQHTGGIVAKWTGDGFLAAYDVPLERDLGSMSKMILEAAWHLSFVVNVTQLGVKAEPSFRIRHGISYEPDAILVKHGIDTFSSTDVIGRGVVLAFRLSGVSAPFPGIVVHRRVVTAALEAGLSHTFKRRIFRRDEILKHFKGERWATAEIFTSNERKVRRHGVKPLAKKVRSLVSRVEAEAGIDKPSSWMQGFTTALASGPEWSKGVLKEWTAFTNEMLGTLKSLLTTLDNPPSSGAVQPAVAADGASRRR